MDCLACGRTNRAGAKFCAGCSTPLGARCPSCGHELAPDSKFCDQCGTPVPEDAAPNAARDPSAARKTVTVLFCDLVGSTSFGERVDAEAAREAMAVYHSMARGVIEGAGGSVAKFIGDGVMALFGVPEVGEDDADRAVAAGLALQQGFAPIGERVAARHDAELGLRVGINTGEIVLADGDADLVGDAINTAARLEAACPAGAVLVGENTWRLTRSHVRYEVLGEVDVRGKDEPVATFRVLDDGVADDEQATPFVGRADELARLRSAFDESVANRSVRLVTVIGAPGVGKTRISRQFCESIGDGASVFELRCERAGTATFAPIADLLRAVTEIDDQGGADLAVQTLRDLVSNLDDADRVADLLASFVGATAPRSTEEAFLAVRRLVESIGRREPVVVVVDDIQWAEPLFLDLLEHLAEWVNDSSALLIGLARPELRDLRPALAEKSRWLSAVITLEGLDAAATAELAARLVGAASLPADLVERLPSSTEGNPLFVRELMRMLVDDGVIEQSGNGWELAIDAEAVEVPPTIQSLLAARLERMPAHERRFLELASVVGPEFAFGAVEAIASGAGADPLELRRSLDRLRRREVVETTGSYWGDEPIYRFHHVLIRDAAYRRLLKRARAELHLRAGEWTARTAAALVGEHEVAIAYHFEQAHEYRRQLDDVDDESIEIGHRAAKLLAVAAERALERDDLASAGLLAERALTRLEGAAHEVPGLVLVACESLLALGDVTRGRPWVERLVAIIGGDDRLAAWADCFVAQLAVLTAPGRLHEVEQTVDAAARRLGELGDEAGVAKARLVRAAALARLGRVGDSEAELDIALTAARSAGDRRRVAAVLGAAPVAALWGPSPIPRAGGRCLDVIRLLRITTGSPAVEATSIRCQAVLEALRGRFDTARSMLADARATAVELGLRHGVNEVDLYAGIVELLAGDPVAAEAPLRVAYLGSARLGIGADAGQAAAYLARALLQQGRLDEADELAADSYALAGQNPQTAIAARAAQAEILAARGMLDQAVALAAEAVELASGTDIVVDHANANAVLARVARLAGDERTANRAARAARALYDQKAATVDVPIEAARPLPGEPASRVPGDAPSRADLLVTRAARLADEATAALARRDPDWGSLLAADVVLDDRRPLVGRIDEGREAVLSAWLDHPLLPGAVEQSCEVLAVRGSDLALIRNEARVSGPDGSPEMTLLAVLDFDEHDRLRRGVLFDHRDLQPAVAELDRLFLERTVDPDVSVVDPGWSGHHPVAGERDMAASRASTSDDVEFVDRPDVLWNEADRLARRLVGLFLDPASDSWFEMLDPDLVTDDHRPLVGYRIRGRDSVRDMWTRELIDDQLSSRFETIAVRGDRLALHLWSVVMRVGSAEWNVLLITRWNEHALVDLDERFDVADLADALAELDRLWLDELGNSLLGDTTKEFVRCRDLLQAGDVDGFAALHAPDFVMRDHRQLGWPELDLDAYRDRLETLADVAGALVVADERELRVDETLSRCWAQRVVYTSPEGLVQTSRSVMVMMVDPLVGISLMEQFDEGDVDVAVARFDELVGIRGPVLANRASVRAHLVSAWSRAGERELVEAAIADDATFVDGYGHSVESFPVRWRRPMAVRGDRLALLEMRDSDDHGGHLLAFEVVEIDDEARLVRVVRFAPAELTAAADLLDRRYVEMVDACPALLAAVDLGRAFMPDDGSAPARLPSDELVSVDHRSTGQPGAGREADVDEASTVCSFDRTFIVRRILAERAEGVVVVGSIWSVGGDGDLTEGMAAIRLMMFADGRFWRIEWFEVDEVDAALARFDELTRLPTPDVHAPWIGADDGRSHHDDDPITTTGCDDLRIAFEADDVATAVEDLDRLYQDEVGGSPQARPFRDVRRPADHLGDGRNDVARSTAATPRNAAVEALGRLLESAIGRGSDSGAAEVEALGRLLESAIGRGSDSGAAEVEWVDRRSAPEEAFDPAAGLEITTVLIELDHTCCLCRVRSSGDARAPVAALLLTATCDERGRCTTVVAFDTDQEDEARRDVTARWYSTLNVRRQTVGRSVVRFGESWVAPSTRPFGDSITSDFELIDGRTLGMGRLDRTGFERALLGRENDGSGIPPITSRVAFSSDDVMVFRAANTGVAPDSGMQWEEVACNVVVTDGSTIARLEMFDEDRWDDAVARAAEIVGAMSDRP